MRSAPSVIFPVGRSAFYAGLLLGLGLLGGLVLLIGSFMGSIGLRGPRFLVGAGTWLMWLGFAAWSWRRTPVGQLHWNAMSGGAEPGDRAGAWSWHSGAQQEGAQLQRVETMLDLQSRVLLRLRNPDAATRWIWVEQGHDPARWDDLRRALRAHA
jgi:hypothetical protein